MRSYIDHLKQEPPQSNILCNCVLKALWENDDLATRRQHSEHRGAFSGDPVAALRSISWLDNLEYRRLSAQVDEDLDDLCYPRSDAVCARSSRIESTRFRAVQVAQRLPCGRRTVGFHVIGTTAADTTLRASDAAARICAAITLPLARRR